MDTTDLSRLQLVREIADVLRDGPKSGLAIRAALNRQPNRVVAALRDHPAYFRREGTGNGQRWVLVSEPPAIVSYAVAREGGVALDLQQI